MHDYVIICKGYKATKNKKLNISFIVQVAWSDLINKNNSDIKLTYENNTI